jgi:hypothetical protein
MGVGDRRLGHASDSLARARCLAVLLVGSEVEGDEEDKVRADNTNASECSEFLSGALANVGKLGEVG